MNFKKLKQIVAELENNPIVNDDTAVVVCMGIEGCRSNVSSFDDRPRIEVDDLEMYICSDTSSGDFSEHEYYNNESECVEIPNSIVISASNDATSGD